ncbi:MAG TPA: GNAT family N-acetyltransferase [Pyrinomonadaceae bacterium]|jgi:N-acetylglutamate synthase-like GNAT family acetyltransferase|nr:GNAT family N-acetyltransferase [Pyrinomonadaceae bacterium]
MIRLASTDEADLLTGIALEAKRYWGYPEHWIKHWEADLTISPEFIRDNHVYVAEAEGEVRGFYALCVSGERAELEHMWVTPASIGTGVGKELFLDAMERAAALDVRDVEIVADPNAAGFYERMGASRIGETDSPIDGLTRKLPRLKINP